MRASTVSAVRSGGGSVWKAGLTAGGVAAAANVLLYGLARGMGVTFLAYIGPDGQAMPVPIGMVIVASIVGALAGTAVRLLLTRRSDRGLNLFKVFGSLFLLVSFAGPLGAGVDVATKVTLMLMHLVAGVAIIRSLSRGVSPSDSLE